MDIGAIIFKFVCGMFNRNNSTVPQDKQNGKTTRQQTDTSVRIPSIPGIPSRGDIGTVTFDLLDYGFDASGILNALTSGTANSIAWVYQDDAIISNAQLTLESESVPEPTSMLGLFILGAVGIGSLKRKQSLNLVPNNK